MTYTPEAEARVAELEARNEVLRATIDPVEQKYRAAEAKLARVIGYAVHDDDCTANDGSSDGGCSCGLRAALSTITDAGADAPAPEETGQ